MFLEIEVDHLKLSVMLTALVTAIFSAPTTQCNIFTA